MSKNLYDRNAIECSVLTTKNYSTSFSTGIRMFHKKYREPIYAIYGFVRFADEIVDTFHHQDKIKIFDSFEKETFDAINDGFSTNPILHAFQRVVIEYKIDHEHIKAFLNSMRMDIDKKLYSKDEYQQYIYGSAEVIGLMCIRIFYNDDDDSYKKLVYSARKLGEAFQKINFLRDIQSDYHERGRIYFPNVSIEQFTNEKKQEIEKEIQFDFDETYKGIILLKKDVRIGIYTAYLYYLKLFQLIQKTDSKDLMKKRYRISDAYKILLLCKAWVQNFK